MGLVTDGGTMARKRRKREGGEKGDLHAEAGTEDARKEAGGGEEFAIGGEWPKAAGGGGCGGGRWRNVSAPPMPAAASRGLRAGLTALLVVSDDGRTPARCLPLPSILSPPPPPEIFLPAQDKYERARGPC